MRGRKREKGKEGGESERHRRQDKRLRDAPDTARQRTKIQRNRKAEDRKLEKQRENIVGEREKQRGRKLEKQRCRGENIRKHVQKKKLKECVYV